MRNQDSDPRRGALRGPAAACLLGAAALIYHSGCSQGLGGGASIVPDVIVKLDAASATEGGDGGATVTVAGYGTVTGRVIFDGSPPTLGPYLPGGALKDPEVCIREQIPDQRLVVSADGGVANVFVYIPRKPAGTKPEAATPPTESVIFDQKTCTFTPHALLLRAGQDMRIRNSDPLVHNTNTNPRKNDKFNNNVAPGESKGILLVYKRGETEPVRVVCDYHAWMLAWHLPLDHPYGALTGPDGSFTIADVPAGTHKFAVWHEGKKVGDYAVTVKPDETSPLEIKLGGASFAHSGGGPPPKTVILSMGSN